MSLVAMEVLLRHAKKNHYGVPAFNVNDLYSVTAAVQSAEEEDSPLILMGWEGELEGPNMGYFAGLALTAGRQSRVPIAVHLDHGTSFEWTIKAIRGGFTSVMLDTSRLPFDENVAATKRVVEAAHAVGVTVEAELGHIVTGDVILTQEQSRANMTDPDEAGRFAKATGIDALAVSVGNAHGLYAYEPHLDFDLLAKIVKKVDCHVVMHGGSGTPGLDQAVKIGCTKVNVGTDIQVAFRKSVKQTLDKFPLEKLDSSTIMGPTVEAMKKVMKAYIHTFGSNGQASKIH